MMLSERIVKGCFSKNYFYQFLCCACLVLILLMLVRFNLALHVPVGIIVIMALVLYAVLDIIVLLIQNMDVPEIQSRKQQECRLVHLVLAIPLIQMKRIRFVLLVIMGRMLL